jgi:RNA polymerase sigma-70 factor (ECF subfamily)
MAQRRQKSIEAVYLVPVSGIYRAMVSDLNGAAPDLSDVEAFRRVYAEHHDELVAVAWRVLRDEAAAEDVVQDVFLGLWMSPASFDARRGSLRSYLRMIVKHRSLDRWRTRVVSVAAVERAKTQAMVGEGAGGSAAEAVIRRETARAVRAAVDSLPESQREAILLAYGSGLSTPEVASVTGAPLGTAKSRVRLGLTAARKALMASEAA